MESAAALCQKAVEKYVLHRREHVLEERFLKRTYPVVGRYTDHFIQRNICRRPVNTMHDIRRGQYDAFVVGSDQIWRPHFFPHIEEAFLSFARGWDVKRVAYAPSFGTDTWEYSAAQTARCARLLKDFDAVSVREQSGVALCRRHLGVSARHVPDPTMLLPASDYSAIIDDYDHWRQAFPGLWQLPYSAGRRQCRRTPGHAGAPDDIYIGRGRGQKPACCRR